MEREKTKYMNLYDTLFGVIKEFKDKPISDDTVREIENRFHRIGLMEYGVDIKAVLKRDERRPNRINIEKILIRGL